MLNFTLGSVSSRVGRKPSAAAATRLFWLDAVDGVTDSNSGVDAATDLSGNGNTFTGTSPNRPVYAENEFQASKAAILFPDFETDYLLHASGITFNLGFSCFITFKTLGADSSASQSGNAPMTILGYSTTGNLMSVGLTGSAGNANAQYNYNTGSWNALTSSGLTLNDGFVHTLAVIHNGSSGAVSLYVDGELEGTATYTYNSDTKVNVIGTGVSFADQVLDLNLAELMMWNGAITDTDVSDLHTRALGLWA